MHAWGNKLKQLREAKGLSQSELALRAGVRRGTINELENGKYQDTRLSTVIQLAAVLRVTLDDLVNLR